jgi:hypothetical protein
MKKTKKEKTAEEKAIAAAKEAQNDKVYSYMMMTDKGVFARKRFRYEDRTADDINAMAKEVVESYNAAPLDSQVTFMLSAFPRMRNYLQKNEPELLVMLLGDQESIEVKN